MASTMVHECDKCGKQLHMDVDFAESAFDKWTLAEVRIPPTGNSFKSYTRVWCPGCWDSISAPSPRVIGKSA